MSDSIIEVENLGKRYRLRHQQEGRRYVALRDVVADHCKRLFRTLRVASLSSGSALPAVEDFWALKDVFFEINHGR